MEYLVTMTTHVPQGRSDQPVEDVRGHEAAHSRELAAQGRLLRIWRPPLQPGEWRSLGLFAAADASQLEQVLASMPLRVWRTDEVMSLGPHPNDPAHTTSSDSTDATDSVPTARTRTTPQRSSEKTVEFLTTFTITVPEGTPSQVVEDTKAREAQRAHELAQQGHLVRLWTLPDKSRALGLWQAQDATEMKAILKSLPLDVWMTIETTPLTQQPNDPAITRS
jgi:muconolactone delta-isomerase